LDIEVERTRASKYWTTYLTELAEVAVIKKALLLGDPPLEVVGVDR
jgi:hypothetical protein